MSGTEELYKDKFNRYVSYVQDTHERNRRKIRVGLRVNLILPWIFLIISYITDRSKLFFLIMWVISLFGIAFYLVYVEYTDYHMQRILKEMDAEGTQSEEYMTLTGHKAARIEEKVTDHLDKREHRKDEAAEDA